jgi:uncharacterized membrane protein (DUF106 family)
MSLDTAMMIFGVLVIIIFYLFVAIYVFYKKSKKLENILKMINDEREENQRLAHQIGLDKMKNESEQEENGDVEEIEEYYECDYEADEEPDDDSSDETEDD